MTEGTPAAEVEKRIVENGLDQMTASAIVSRLVPTEKASALRQVWVFVAQFLVIFLGILVFLAGLFLYMGNRIGFFPTFPFAGGITMGIGRGLSGYRLTRPAEDNSLLDVAEAVGWSVRLELPRVPVKGGAGLHRRLQAAWDDAAEMGRAFLRAVSLADLLDGG
jgi:hypothetical protein